MHLKKQGGDIMFANFKRKNLEDSRKQVEKNDQQVNSSLTKKRPSINIKRTFNRVFKVASKMLRDMLFSIIALLVLQHFVPEVAERLPNLYGLLNEVMIPVAEWCYGVVMNAFREFANLPVIRDILEILKSLA